MTLSTTSILSDSFLKHSVSEIYVYLLMHLMDMFIITEIRTDRNVMLLFICETDNMVSSK